MTKDNAKAPEQAVDQQQVLKDLLALGKKNGRLSLKEIADALSQLELESDDIDKLYETLENMGVEVETGGVLEKALGDDEDDVRAGDGRRSARGRTGRHLCHGGDLCHRRPGAYVPQGNRQGRPADARGGGHSRRADAEGQRGRCPHRGRGRRHSGGRACAAGPGGQDRRQGEKASGGGKPAPGGFDRQALCRPRHAVPRSDSGGQPGPDQGGREVRLDQGL